jgi:thiosulfate/3-mercaptopyruvate sulfurtransferase
MRFIARCLVISLAAGFALFAAAPAAASGRKPTRSHAAMNSVGFEQALIQPAELAKQLKEPAAKRPVVLHVGFQVLYTGAHVPGAIFAGPASTAAGLGALRRAAARIPRDREVVIYCGCCPMTKCPNIHPAYDALSKMGFRRLRVLNLPDDFAHDWVEKGLPVHKGSQP